jgi:hypothetical protein
MSEEVLLLAVLQYVLLLSLESVVVGTAYSLCRHRRVRVTFPVCVAVLCWLTWHLTRWVGIFALIGSIMVVGASEIDDLSKKSSRDMVKHELLLVLFGASAVGISVFCIAVGM